MGGRAMVSAADWSWRDLLGTAALALCGLLGRVADGAGRVAFPLGELTANCCQLRVRQLRPLETDKSQSTYGTACSIPDIETSNLTVSNMANFNDRSAGNRTKSSRSRLPVKRPLQTGLGS